MEKHPWFFIIRQETDRESVQKRLQGDRKRQIPFLCFDSNNFSPSLPPMSVRLSGVCCKNCYICILMTPPVAPEAGPSALPRDQLGPGPSVYSAPL